MDALNAEAEKIRHMSDEKSTNNSSFLEPLRPRSDSGTSERTLLNMSDTEENEKARSADLEKEGVEGQLPTIEIKDHVTEDPLARIKLLCWMFINTVATVLIVSCPPLASRSQCSSPVDADNMMHFHRSFVTKPSSATNRLDNVKPPSLPSTSSSQVLRYMSSLGRLSPCSIPNASLSPACFLSQSPCP